MAGVGGVEGGLDERRADIGGCGVGEHLGATAFSDALSRERIIEAAVELLDAHYVLGAAGQNAGNARVLPPDGDRGAFLDAAATTWEKLDPDRYPFTRAVADQLRDHDDRAQFLAGVDLILTGIATTPR